ncbi:MAG: DUF167 domain-containing protein [Acidimicrobiia bacterium]
MKVEDSIREIAGAVEISVRCQPGSAKTGIVGFHGDSLKVKVRSPALEGRANQELILLLAEALGLRPHALTLASGERSRVKRVRVEGMSSTEVAQKLGPLAALT